MLESIPDALASHNMASLQQLRNTHPSFKLTGQAYPASTVADLAIAATGASVERSGIVGDAWINENGVFLFRGLSFVHARC